MPKTGWTIQVTRCAYLNADATREVYAVNLVMPSSDDSLLQGSRGPALPVPQDARSRSLLQPWTWKTPIWHVFARLPTPNGQPVIPWQPVGVPQALDAGAAGGPLPVSEIGDEVFSRTEECDHAYSVSAEDIGKPGESTRSLPHALAPLTHWPAGASNAALRMAGFLTIDSAELDAIGEHAEIVCFPAFTLDGDAAAIVPATPVTNPAFGCELAAYTPDPEVTMACRACSRDTPVWQRKLKQPTGGHDDMPRAAVRTRAARELAPLSILIRAATDLVTAAEAPDSPDSVHDFAKKFAATDAQQRTGWTEALWRFLPNGWGWSPTDANGKLVYDRHILARLMPSSQAKHLADATFTPAATALRDAIVVLAERKPTNGWTLDAQRAWQRAGLAWNELAGTFEATKTKALTEGLRYLRAWLEVARMVQDQDGARQLMGPWLVTQLTSPWPDVDPAQKDDALTPERLKNMVVTDSMVRASMLGLLFTTPVWAWIDAPASEKTVDLSKHLVDVGVGGLHLADLLKDYPDIDKWMEQIATRFVAAIQRGANPATARPRDLGLPLQFESGDPGDGFDESVRGYAVALCPYLPAQDGQHWLVDQDGAQWITDTAVLHRGAQDPWLSTQDGVWWLHETIGSTSQDGIRTVQAEYIGKPLSVMCADDAGRVLDADKRNTAPDESAVVDLLWHPSRKLPPLGYGLHYKAIVSCIDNAGGVIEADLRDPVHCAQLKEAANVFKPQLPLAGDGSLLGGAPQWQYRSAVPPGAPTLRGGPEEDAYALSDETMAHAFQVDQQRQREKLLLAQQAAPVPGGTPLARIALLKHDQTIDGTSLFAQPSKPFTYTLSPPPASTEFIERWLDTDIVLLKRIATGPAPLGNPSDPAFVDAVRVREFRNDVLTNISPKTDVTPYHPAVSAIGVAVWVKDQAAPLLSHAFRLTRTEPDQQTGHIRIAPSEKRQVTLNVSASAAVASPSVVIPSNAPLTLNLTLPAGSFVRVRAFSLVLDSHFDSGQASSTDHRFYPGIELPMGDDVPMFTDATTNARFRAFGPTEFWCETAPRWDKDASSFSLIAVGPGKAPRSGETPLPPDLLALACDTQDRATWVKSLFIQRHEWHWTGYPVRLPQDEALEQWLASFAGVESYREAAEIGLETGFATGAWRYGPAGDGKLTLFKKALQQGARPARYAAFTARPVVRFAKLLNRAFVEGPLALERRVYAVGTLVPGVSPAGDARLPVPPLRWAVPLTATYIDAADNAVDPKRIACGNLLVIDDALRRTDQLSRMGGIADTLEIDVVETRMQAFDEIGPNPIFHGNPDKTKRPCFKLHQHAPFGLTNDNSANALVSQTAVVVTIENSAGQWMLAKVQARRLVLPEAMVSNELPEDQDYQLAGHQAYVLGTRIEGEQAVPLDFALDFIGHQPNAVHLNAFGIILNPQTSSSRTLTSQLPDAGGDGYGYGRQLRYLCSWHKRRWNGGGDPTWRLQVLAQRRTDDDLDWVTVHKLSGHQNPGTQIDPGSPMLQVRLALPTPVYYTARPVRMSDYTDPIWLTFIGSFGREQFGRPEQYRCVSATGNLTLQGIDDAPSLMLHGVEDSGPCFHILLVYRPLADITRGDIRNDTGALIGAYVYSEESGHQGFKQMVLGSGPAGSLSNCFAYLCTVQRITAASTVEATALHTVANFALFQTFVDGLFPKFVDGLFPKERESTMRLLPEYLGPIPVDEV